MKEPLLCFGWHVLWTASRQARRFGPKKIRHNSVRSAFVTYSGFRWPYALSLIKCHYGISRGEIPLCRAFHKFTRSYSVSAHRSTPPPRLFPLRWDQFRQEKVHTAAAPMN
jgi:hypothetical protein